MIDCGIPFAKMKEDLYECDYLFLTHRHTDHFKPSTYKMIKKFFPNIIVCAGPDMFRLANMDRDRDIVTVAGDFINLETFLNVTVFDAVHDVPTQGFVFHFDDGTYNIIYCTDTSTLENAPDMKYSEFFIEANYDKKKLDAIANSKHGIKYDFVGGASRHLSKQDSKKFYYLHRENKDCPYHPLHQSSRFY